MLKLAFLAFCPLAERFFFSRSFQFDAFTFANHVFSNHAVVFRVKSLRVLNVNQVMRCNMGCCEPLFFIGSMK